MFKSLPKKLEPLQIFGADGHPIHVGDPVVATVSEGGLRWGIYRGALKTTRRREEYYRFYIEEDEVFGVDDPDKSYGKYSYINGCLRAKKLETNKMIRR